MRILFVMASPEYLRFYDSTIRGFTDRGHHVMLAVMQQKDGKPVRLDDLGAPGLVEVLGLVPPRDDVWYRLARLVRGAMDYVRYLHPRFADAPALRQRLAKKGLPRSLRGIDARLGVYSDGTVRRLLRALAAVERGIPTSRPIERFLSAQRPDVVVVSPLVDVASDQVDVVRAARRLGLRVVAAIASWDNLTNKGLLRVEPDAVLVWNEAQKREAIEMHGIAGDRVIVTGAQLFDKWFHKTTSRTLGAFAAHVGLPRAEPFVLFTGSSMFISPPEEEVAFVKKWLATLRGSRHEVLRDALILVRPHPYNGWIWEHVDVSAFGPIAVWPRGRYNPISPENRDDFFDSLHYCRAVVGINTSAMVEASILGKAVHSIASDDFARTQEGTLHFHHLLPEHGGFLRIGRGLDHHADLLAASLADETGAREETTRFVSWFLRPHGVDRDCTPIVIDAIERLAGSPVRPAEGVLGTAAARILAITLLPVAVYLTRRAEKPVRGPVGARLRNSGRQRRRQLDRLSKTTVKLSKTTVKRVKRLRKDVAVRLKEFRA
jgi:hypothetical protein